jgi:hypothetical protein
VLPEWLTGLFHYLFMNHAYVVLIFLMLTSFYAIKKPPYWIQENLCHTQVCSQLDIHSLFYLYLLFLSYWQWEGQL